MDALIKEQEPAPAPAQTPTERQRAELLVQLLAPVEMYRKSLPSRAAGRLSLNSLNVIVIR